MQTKGEQMSVTVKVVEPCPPHIWNIDCPTVAQKGCSKCRIYRPYTDEEARASRAKGLPS